MLFTLLTFPLRCTLDIEQCGRGPLFHGPFANEAIKSLLPRLWKGGGRVDGWVGGGVICCLSKHPSISWPPPARGIHNKLCFCCRGPPRSLWSPLVSATLSIARDHRRHQATCMRGRPSRSQWEGKGKGGNGMMSELGR